MNKNIKNRMTNNLWAACDSSQSSVRFKTKAINFAIAAAVAATFAVVGGQANADPGQTLRPQGNQGFYVNSNVYWEFLDIETDPNGSFTFYGREPGQGQGKRITIRGGSNAYFSNKGHTIFNQNVTVYGGVFLKGGSITVNPIPELWPDTEKDALFYAPQKKVISGVNTLKSTKIENQYGKAYGIVKFGQDDDIVFELDNLNNGETALSIIGDLIFKPIKLESIKLDKLPSLNKGELYNVTLIDATNSINQYEVTTDFTDNKVEGINKDKPGFIIDNAPTTILGGERGSDFIYNLISTKLDLKLVAANGKDNGEVKWTGANGLNWDTTSENWTGKVGGENGVLVDTFLNGDDVIFGKNPVQVRSFGPNVASVAVAEDIEAGKVTIEGDYLFTDNAITAREVLVKEEASMGLEILADGPSLITGDLTFENDAELGIAGFAAKTMDEAIAMGQEAHLLIESANAISGLDLTKLNNDLDQFDFLSAKAELRNDNKEVWVSTQLAWVSNNSNDPAHGTFTLAEEDDQFILDVALEDNTGSNRAQDWDGKTLSKEGEGTLILAADNLYTGSTIVNAGTLVLGNGGTTGSVAGNIEVGEHGTLVFNRSGDVEVANLIEGDGVLNKENNNTLTISGDNTFSGTTNINAGTLLVTGKLPGTINAAENATLQVNGGATLGSVALNKGSTFDVALANTIDGDLIANEATLIFHPVSEMVNGPAYLTVSGDATINDSTILIDVKADSPVIAAGEKLTLADVAGTLTADPDNLKTAIGKQGISMTYNFELVNENGKLVAQQVGKVLNQETKSLSEGIMAGIAGISQGGELAADAGMKNAVATAPIAGQGFAAVGGSDLRYKTGSHVDVQGFNVVAGVSKAFANRMTVGAFFEYGNSSYDSYNSFANGAVKGKGDTDYVGGGILAHHEYGQAGENRWYSEVSARAGRVKSDFQSNDLKDLNNVAAAFDSKATYFGASLGGGYLMQLGQKTELDLHGRLMWSHQGSDTVTLSTGDVVGFDAVNSERLRFGARLNNEMSETVKVYAGAAYDYEFDAKAKAHINGYSVDTPKLSGSTVMGEVGLTVSPLDSLSLDFGVQGYAGKREGVSGSVQVKYSF